MKGCKDHEDPVVSSFRFILQSICQPAVGRELKVEF